jgi:hypothetical protein
LVKLISNCLESAKNCAGPTREAGSFLNTPEFSWLNL